MDDVEITTKPFRSRAQWAKCFAMGDPRWDCHRWARETPGGKGRRFRALPRKVKSLSDLLLTFKAAGYSARAGETIRGNLARGGDGKFTSAGNASAAAPKAPRPAKRPKLRRRRDEREQEYEARVEAATQERAAEGAQREQDQTNERQANREAIYANQGLAEDAQAALTALFEGGDNTDDGGLVKMGLAEQNRDGTYRLTPAGRQYVRAAERGDAAMARDTLAAARDKKASRDERQTATAQRRQEAQAKRQQREAERAKKLRERLSRKPKGRQQAARQERRPAPSRSEDQPATAQQLARFRLAMQRLVTLRQQLTAAQTKSTLTVFKDSRGADRWLSITTTAYQDKDGEWISRKAIAQAVALGDQTGQRGPLRFWHIPGLDFGDCDYQATAQDGRFLIESGTCYSPAHAVVVKAAATRGYQMSPGFIHSRHEPRGGVFSNIAIFERSFVPPGRASNPYTRLSTTKEAGMSLTPEKEAALKQLADDPKLLERLLTQIDTTDKAAQQEQATYKDAPPWAQAILTRLDALEASMKAAPPVVEEDEKATAAEMAGGDMTGSEDELADAEADDSAEMEAMLEAIADRVVAKLAPMLEIEKKMRGYVDEMKSAFGSAVAQKDDAQAKELAALKADVAELKGDQPAGFVFGRGYRASADPATATTNKARQKPAEGVYDKALPNQGEAASIYDDVLELLNG
jgi:hypothetical protein